MAEFAYNNAKNANTGHTPFKPNCSYHLYVSFDKDTNPCSQLKTAEELSSKLRELMTVYQKNLQHAQELQKQAYNKGVKPRSYVFGNKVYLNSKYIKTKQNRKLEAKFFEPFWVLHAVGKQAYKLKLPKKWRVQKAFHISLLEQNTTMKELVSKEVPELDADNKNSKQYKIKAIRDSTVSANELESGYLPSLHYLVA